MATMEASRGQAGECEVRSRAGLTAVAGRVAAGMVSASYDGSWVFFEGQLVV